MSVHMKTPPTRQNSCEIVINIPGRKSEISYLPTEFVGHLEAFLAKYAERDSVDWTVVANDSIVKYKQAGMVLRGARFRESISQKKLAQLSGVSQDNISRIENGKRKIGEKVAKKLAEHLNIDYTLLLEDVIS